VRLAPDNDAAVRVDVALPLTAPSGALVSFPITATAVGDPNATASLDVQVRVSGISTQLLVVVGLLVAVILVAIIAVVGRRRRRRPLN